MLTHAATGKPFVTKYAQSVFGQQRATLDTAWPGDVIGLANAAALRPGDTLYRDVPVQYPPIPSFSPEHFAVARGADPSKHKQFRRGIEQLEQEGVVQVLRSDRRGDQAPVLAAVGPMQFEVATHRMATELSAPISLESLPYQVARIVDPADAEFMDKQVSVGSADPHRRRHARAVLHPVAAGGLPTGQPRREAGVVGGGGRLGRAQGVIEKGRYSLSETRFTSQWTRSDLLHHFFMSRATGEVAPG